MHLVHRLGIVALLLTLAGCAISVNPDTPQPRAKASRSVNASERALLEQQVADAERAFAKTMADRDLVAFERFLSRETVWKSGPDGERNPLRGPAAVVGYWKRYFETPAAPFSWSPESVHVLDSGELAISAGPVFDPKGKRIATYTSIWRQEAPGVWKVIFDWGAPWVEPVKP